MSKILQLQYCLNVDISSNEINRVVGTGSNSTLRPIVNGHGIAQRTWGTKTRPRSIVRRLLCSSYRLGTSAVANGIFAPLVVTKVKYLVAACTTSC
jgi:hypothetical protein